MEKLLKEEILSLFAKKSRRKLYLPNLENIDWENLDFLGWIHPSGHLGYIVYEFENNLIGLILERNRPLQSSGIKMCSLCYSLHMSSGVRLFTYKIDKNNSIGDYFCTDSQCSLYIRGIKKVGNENDSTILGQMPESITLEEKIKRLKDNLNSFIKRIKENKFYER